uniref:Uncharacterized protein n=1 Tax=Arundo donax TaxID=35708 RepID=A0A0A9GXJ5_ARUDO
MAHHWHRHLLLIHPSKP